MFAVATSAAQRDEYPDDSESEKILIKEFQQHFPVADRRRSSSKKSVRLHHISDSRQSSVDGVPPDSSSGPCKVILGQQALHKAASELNAHSVRDALRSQCAAAVLLAVAKGDSEVKSETNCGVARNRFSSSRSWEHSGQCLKRCWSESRSRSNDDEIMFKFLETHSANYEKVNLAPLATGYPRRARTDSSSAASVTRSPQHLATAQMATSDGDLNGTTFGLASQPNSRNVLVDLDTPMCKLDSATASNGNLDILGGKDGLTPTSSSFNIVTINVSGLRFQTRVETLERYPNTLLGDPSKRAPHYNPKTNEYFFDRHRVTFESILYFYQSAGRLKRPESVPVDVFARELKFFEMGSEVMEQFFKSEGYSKPQELVLPKNSLQRHTWLVMEHPDSSLLARVVAFFSVFVIVVSTVSFCLETIPELKINTTTYHPHHNRSGMANGDDASTSGSTTEEGTDNFENPFFIVEFACMCWFTLEFLLRFASSPSKWVFCKSFLNIIDFVAIVPFFVNLALRGAGGSTPPFAVLRVFRLVRVFRIFKLSRHSRGLQILGKTFAASVQELCLLVFFLVIGLVLFSSAVYFAETNYNPKFRSIPHAFWYVIVTMTTVGYGDLTPEGPWGKIVGGMCAIVGVLVLALPVPVIVANFKHYYRLETRLAHMRQMEGEGDGDDEEACDNDSRSS